MKHLKPLRRESPLDEYNYGLSYEYKPHYTDKSLIEYSKVKEMCKRSFLIGICVGIMTAAAFVFILLRCL